jgi:hypothetical protein
VNSNPGTSHNVVQDVLVSSLLDLALTLKNKDIPLIIGGGLSMYLRHVFLDKKRSPRFPLRIVQRSTKDIDIFLTGNIIVDAEKVTALRDSLKGLDFIPRTKYFQFEKETPGGTVLIDILSSPPHTTIDAKFKIKRPRIGNINVEKFHGYLVDEAIDIEFGMIPVKNIAGVTVSGIC